MGIKTVSQRVGMARRSPFTLGSVFTPKWALKLKIIPKRLYLCECVTMGIHEDNVT